MSNFTKNQKPRTPKSLLAILVKMADRAEAGKPVRVTAADLDTTSIYMGRLEREGLVKAVDTVRTGRRGRPANIYGFTPKGRGRAQRATREQA